MFILQLWKILCMNCSTSETEPKHIGASMQLGQLYSAFTLKKDLPFEFFDLPSLQKPGRNYFRNILTEWLRSRYFGLKIINYKKFCRLGYKVIANTFLWYHVFFIKPGFHSVYYIGTMPRLLQWKPVFFNNSL